MGAGTTRLKDAMPLLPPPRVYLALKSSRLPSVIGISTTEARTSSSKPSTEQLTSMGRLTASSTMTRRSNEKASSSASDRLLKSVARLTPMEDPKVAGLTKTG